MNFVLERVEKNKKCWQRNAGNQHLLIFPPVLTLSQTIPGF